MTLPKTITLAPVDPNHLRNVLYAARQAMISLRGIDLINVSTSIAEIETLAETAIKESPPEPTTELVPILRELPDIGKKDV